MNSISKNVYIDKLFDIVNKYDNTYHRTNKMKALDVKSSTYIDPSKEINDEDPEDPFLEKAIFQICLKFLGLKKLKNIVPWSYVISDINGKEIVGMFYKKELQKAYKIEF